MTLREVYDKIDALYPKKLSDDYVKAYGGHDNSGILLDHGREITGAVFSLDCSIGAVRFAAQSGCNLLVTHHPAIFYPISELRKDDPLGARLISCIENGIGVASMHLNFDCAVGGIDENLARAAGGCGALPPIERIEGGGYGRVFDVERQVFAAFAERLKCELHTERVFIYGNGTEEIARVASFCGAGVDGGSISAALREKADVIVSADIKHNYICDALEEGLKVVQLTHYASENYGFKKIYENLKDKLGVPCKFYEDAFML